MTTADPARDLPPLTDAEIAEIEARASLISVGAVPGPWWVGRPLTADAGRTFNLPVHYREADEDGETFDGTVCSITYDPLGFQYPHEDNRELAEFIAAARTDVPRLVAALRAAREERDQAQADLALATEFTICGHPNPASINAESYMVQVAYRDVNRWAVIRHGYCLDAAGNWEYESRPSERRDEWLATHRFSLPDAMRLARQAAPLLSINGMTGPQCHEWELSRMESADV